MTIIRKTYIQKFCILRFLHVSALPQKDAIGKIIPSHLAYYSSGDRLQPLRESDET